MTRGIVIPAVTFLPLEERDFTGLQNYQDAVGGYIEPITLHEAHLTLYVNEEGKTRAMSFNERATALWWLLAPTARGQDLIVGDVVLLPDDPGRGEALMKQLQCSGGLMIEVQVREAVGEWLRGAAEFPSWFEAAKFALLLQERFGFIEAVRIVAP